MKSFTGQITDIDLRMLRIFKNVVECGGFAAAEVTLNISRPAISVAISDLESRLNMCLCQRGRSGFIITDEGKGVYDSILQLFNSIDTFKSQINALHECLHGDLNIGVTDNLVTIPHMTISNAFARLKKIGPNVNINIRMSPPVTVEREVIDGALHVGVVPKVKTLPSIEYRPLYKETSYLYCALGHPLFDGEITDVNEIHNFDAVTSAYVQSSEVKKIEQSFHSTAQATDREGVAFLILTGAFIGFLPCHFASKWVEENKLKAILPEQFSYETDFVAITRKGARPNRVVEKFIEQLMGESQLV